MCSARIFEQDVLVLDTSNCLNFYNMLKANGDALVLNNWAETDGTLAPAVTVKWENRRRNLIVERVAGCIVLIGVSSR
jgi:hypothetical protein